MLQVAHQVDDGPFALQVEEHVGVTELQVGVEYDDLALRKLAQGHGQVDRDSRPTLPPLRAEERDAAPEG